MAGFFDGLYESTQNPLFLGGIGLMTGGAPAMFQGMQTGAGLQDRIKKQQREASFIDALKGMPGVDQNTMAMLQANPELGQQVAGNMISHRMDPMADIKRKTAEANLAQTQQENEMFPLKRQQLQAQTAQALRGGETPSNVKEWEYFNRLPPEQRQQYLSMKRAEKYYDLGTSYARPDPLNPGQISGAMPKDVAGAASLKEQGEAQGKAAADLPRQMDNAGVAIQTIEAIRKHPGKKWGVGAAGVIPGVPGTEQRGFVNLVDQAKGQVFLQAFNSLRGGGAITDAEGAKATQALSRLDRAQRQEDFDAALTDLEGIINMGVHRARGAAKHSPQSDGWQTLPGGIRIREKR